MNIGRMALWSRSTSFKKGRLRWSETKQSGQIQQERWRRYGLDKLKMS